MKPRTRGTIFAIRPSVQRTPFNWKRMRRTMPITVIPRQTAAAPIIQPGSSRKRRLRRNPVMRKNVDAENSMVLSTRTPGIPSVKGTCRLMRKARAASPPTLAEGMSVFSESLMILVRKRRRSGTGRK
jgi:hypothetical protein